MDYSIHAFMDLEHWCIRLGSTGTNLLPIAGLDYAGHDCRGMEEFDLLCLHYADAPDPAVVTWPFDTSFYGREPEIIRVADTFAEFLPLLFRDENPITAEQIDTY